MASWSNVLFSQLYELAMGSVALLFEFTLAFSHSVNLYNIDSRLVQIIIIHNNRNNVVFYFTSASRDRTLPDD